MIEWPIDPWLAAKGLLSISERRKFDAFLSNTHQAKLEYLEIMEMHRQLETVAEKDLPSSIPEKTLSLLNLCQKPGRSTSDFTIQGINGDMTNHIFSTSA